MQILKVEGGERVALYTFGVHLCRLQNVGQALAFADSNSHKMDKGGGRGCHDAPPSCEQA